MSSEPLMTREEVQKEIQWNIERFARSVGLPYDPPNLFDEFKPQKSEWDYSNALTMARMSVLVYQKEHIVKSRLNDCGVADSKFAWFEDKRTDTQGFGCTLQDSLIICFRGSESI